MKIASMRDPLVAAAVRRGDPGYVYVGRSNVRPGVRAHPLSNPFKLTRSKRVHREQTRAWALGQYEYRLRHWWLGPADQPPHPNWPKQWSAFHALKPTDTLVCWCASCTRDPYPDPENHADGCHGDIIARVWAERNGGAA